MISNTKRILAAICCMAFTAAASWGCTSAVIGAKASASGRPMLWKHRDTSAIDNKVEYVAPADGGYGYVALFNAADRDLREAWTGMNDVGFAIMNTASYNIKDDDVPARDMDKEGLVMTIALRSCRTVDDFAALLDSLPRPMGVEADFGVIDATGAGAYFETNNHSYVRYDVDDAPGNYLVRSNYSHSGRPGEGLGYIREQNAVDLLEPHRGKGDISPELLTETLSRSFWHSLMKRDFASPDAGWVVDQDFIPRYKSTATIVIEGCRPMADAVGATPEALAGEYVMWTGLGYPPVAEIYPVWCAPDGVHEDLRGTGEKGHSAASDLAKARRDSVFPIHRGSGDRYIDMSRLVNADGTGLMQTAVAGNREIYRKLWLPRRIDNDR